MQWTNLLLFELLFERSDLSMQRTETVDFVLIFAANLCLLGLLLLRELKSVSATS